LAERIDWKQPRVLIHGDVATHNLLADADNNLLALIDWGDATWAPRAMDFAKLPLTQAAQILPTYLHHTHSQPRRLLPQTSPPTTTSPTRTTTPDTAAPTETAGPARTTGTAARAGTAGTAGRAETEGTAGAAGHVSSAIGGPATAAAEELAAGVLWFHLSWALAKLPASPWPDQRHWTAPTASRLVNLLHFFTTNPPAPWSALV
jgi:serine/threonine protein kinase